MLPTKRKKLSQNFEKETQAQNAIILKSIEQFQGDLYRCIADDEEGNFVNSGLSVYLVLSMCAFGARKKTAKEMFDVLHLNEENLSSDFKDIINHFKYVPNITLNIVNSIFVDKSIVLKDSFKEHVSNNFLSEVSVVDFAFQPDIAVGTINNWCAKNTNNKIRQILSTNDVNDLTRLILTNAVYFKANWLNKFSVFSSDQSFFIDKQTTINVPTMYAKRRFLYKNLESLNAECITIPYKNQDYLFVVIKPKEVDGLKQFESDLEKIELDYGDKFSNGDFQFRHIRFQLPKFKIVSRIDMSKFLQRLGMVRVFTEKANLKDIYEKPRLIPPLHLYQIFQKAFIEVNEIGTEAAAVTFSCMRGGGRGPVIQWHDFKVDRPFLYRVVNKTTNLTLFSGRITRPLYD